MSASGPDELPVNERERGGSGPMIVILLACVLLCAGSIGGIGFVAWRWARTAEEREAEEAERTVAVQRETIESRGRERFTRVARAVGEGLQAEERLADSYTADGLPLLSWRVHLLPRLGEDALYRRFKLDEPWDSPANRSLINLVPEVYMPTTKVEIGRWAPGWTHIRGFSHPGAIFEPRARYALRDIPGGPANTLGIVDSAEPDVWTKPDAWSWEPGGRVPKLGWLSPDPDLFLAAAVDGRVLQVRRTIPDEMLRQLFDRRVAKRDMGFAAHVIRE